MTIPGIVALGFDRARDNRRGDLVLGQGTSAADGCRGATILTDHMNDKQRRPNGSCSSSQMAGRVRASHISPPRAS